MLRIKGVFLSQSYNFYTFIVIQFYSHFNKIRHFFPFSQGWELQCELSQSKENWTCSLSCSSGWEWSVQTCLRCVGWRSWPAPPCSVGRVCSVESWGHFSAHLTQTACFQGLSPATKGLTVSCGSVWWRAAWSIAYLNQVSPHYEEAEQGKSPMLGGDEKISLFAVDHTCKGCTQDACFDYGSGNLQMTQRSCHGYSWPPHCCNCGWDYRAHLGYRAWKRSPPWS